MEEFESLNFQGLVSNSAFTKLISKLEIDLREQNDPAKVIELIAKVRSLFVHTTDDELISKYQITPENEKEYQVSIDQSNGENNILLR